MTLDDASKAIHSAGRVAFVGRPGLGGVRMRGYDVAERLGVPFVRESELRPGEWDCLILVKYWTDAAAVRAAAKRLIFDPLDVWSSNKTRYRMASSAFWRWTHDTLRFDDVLATSPSCEAAMLNAVRDRAAVHLCPHHADPRILEFPGLINVEGWWRNPRGPVVYAGGMRYVASALDAIREACQSLGKRLEVFKDDEAKWNSIQAASVVLHPRCAPHDTELNRRCKPQVKLENAVAAGIPIVATACEAATSCRPEVETVDHQCVESSDVWRAAIERAIERGPLKGPAESIENHARRVAQIVANRVDGGRV